MTHPGGSDRSDLSSWWVDLLADELGDCASVDRAVGPAEGIAVVTLTPFRAEALAMRIVVGDGSVPEIEFGTARPFVCAGVPTEDGVGGIDPSNQLGVMVAAVITDGAALVRTRFTRRTLVLGHGDRDEEVADARVLHRWPPYADDYVMSTVFRQPPEYATLPRRAFILPGVVARP
ncbi:hypothetical protein GCM10010988_20360 [Cnuibacter physcomitrellae]|uniref:Uncharacterized protein n=1 Tax=Cnuibacter physcomitrellae TaxID=1619308 RepID=A0A1X9LNH5_9MICO|nr:hypothetical protein [Cnuibacter physcomitrellae]ARJ06733.1 hypothetical protein B5808_17005 [Cnuibacter physcomitrellae]GGI38706.1 hypothetical protein GCM10010988_20360 [Cnuibacter physcomitrellae]